MLRLTDVQLPLDHADDDLIAAIIAHLGIARGDLLSHTVFRRGYDARKRSAIALVYTLDVEVKNEAAVLKRKKGNRHVSLTPDTSYKHVAQAPTELKTRPVVIGFGPCGLFAALILAEMGFKPIILERGKVVRERTKDTWGLWRKRELQPESNVQFGEGGAGTFSDGKLWTQVKDPKHYGRKVLTEFVAADAPPEIMYVSKPHIGTFRLVKMIELMRAKIVQLGGEFRFEARVDDVLIEDGRMRSLILSDGTQIDSDHVVLAIGHSARDTFEMLHKRGVYMEAKPFSMGFRIEHPQSLIDACRFGPSAGHPILGAADYKLVHHASNGRGVYSFCMCPGGTVVAATSEPGRVVTNGMSQYSRNERNANAGIVVGITPDDYPGGPLAGMEMQRFWESRAFELGGSNYDAPGQLVGDFIANKPSTAFGKVQPSYKPGVKLGDLNPSLPYYAIDAIREALTAFDKQIKGFSMHDAVLTGIETRTSSPVRIKRNDQNLQSLNTRGLYPAGEGAGYAGGIMSAAIDGIRVAEAVALDIVQGKQ
ncbi:NAD(P)/FAD-dependent oxidoreductase [uncultured Oxalicibacterium sp.]|uniref:NAD(P)/FAD-dependent oxidoreductase n=1 Tax=uncultured Oxalicibacterium sp. TaxID=1168540 RepID=UPI0025F26E09|nr:NAD(P)/FAD-dependent oxidoreductase [uncultured Oxalicibacterium sp.]